MNKGLRGMFIKGKGLKLIGIILVMGIGIFMVVNFIIANNVISSMADIRIEKNSATLEDYNLVGEQINVVSADGLIINAYIVPKDDSKGNVLILHGMHGMDATSLFEYAKFIYDSGFTPVCIDMRAHGKSEGERLSFGYHEVYDVMAVMDFLKKDSRFKDKPIILYGLSMGGSTAINVASNSEYVDGIIAVSPFLSIQEQVADYMNRDGLPSAFVKVFQPVINLVLWHKFDVAPIKDSPEYAIKRIDNIPVFIIHGDKDTQTDVSHSQALYNNSSSDTSELWIVNNKDHLIVEDVLNDDSEYYRVRIIKFLNDNFGR